MENKVKVWLARDEDGYVGGHKLKPMKFDGEWRNACSQLLDIEYWFNLDTSNLKWEDDEPTEAYITLANEPQLKKEIDWEQRRYEIIRDNLFHCPITDNLDEYKSYLTVAFKRAEILINELKKQSK